MLIGFSGGYDLLFDCMAGEPARLRLQVLMGTVVWPGGDTGASVL